MQEECPLLTLPNVEAALHCLTLGSSNLKQAEGALLSWQKQQVNPYTFALLCATLNPQVRLAALLSLKAVVKQSWKDRGRSSQRQFLDEPTKQQVRALLLSFVTTGENPLVHQETVDRHYRNQYNAESVVQDRTVQAAATSCLVQVALFDLPKISQDLVPLLVNRAISQQQHVVQKRNSLFALEALLEELSEKRLLGIKQYLRTVAVNHVASLIQEGARHVTMVGMDATLSETCSLLIRTIRYLLHSSLITIMESPGQASCAAVDHWMKLIFDCSAAYLTKRQQESVNDVESTRLIELMWELVVEVQQAHPIAFGRYLEPFLNMYYNVIFLGFDGTSSVGDLQTFLKYYEDRMYHASPMPDELLILALRFMANVASCSQYLPDAETNEAVPNIQSDEARTNITAKGDAQFQQSHVQHAVHVVWNSFFSSHRVCDLADLCICHFMAISPEAIEDWVADPENYFIAEDSRNAEENVAVSAQALFCSFIEALAARPIVIPRLIALLNDSESQMNVCRQEIVGKPVANGSCPKIHPSVVLWEAIYTAAGLSATVLEDFEGWDFQSWYRRVLLPCLNLFVSNNDSTQLIPLLRRRIVWLVGCNASGLSRDLSPFQPLIKIITYNTSKSNDIAVKLAAVQVISTMLGNFDEAAADCALHAEFIIDSLYRLANEFVELESQSMLLDVIPLVLLYMTGTGRDITATVANASVSPLPSIWDCACGKRVLLRRSIITILSIVTSSIGPGASEILFPISFHILASSLDTSASVDHAFQVDETLLLWLTTLRFTETYSDPIGTLFPALVGLLEVDFEHLRLSMMVTEMYILIGGKAFLTSHSESLCKLFRLTINNVRPRGVKYIGLVLEALLRECPKEGGLLLLSSGILETMLRSCALNYTDNPHCEPDRVITVYLNALSRILVVSPALLDNVFPLNTGAVSFGCRELVHLYIKLLNDETPIYSQIFSMKFLFSLLPPSGATSAPECQTTRALDDMMVPFLSQCILCLPRAKHVRESGGPYKPELYDEETIDAGHERYEAILRHAVTKDAIAKVDLMDLAREKVAFSKSNGGKTDPGLLTALIEILQ